jgi:hypothetical protein
MSTTPGTLCTFTQVTFAILLILLSEWSVDIKMLSAIVVVLIVGFFSPRICLPASLPAKTMNIIQMLLGTMSVMRTALLHTFRLPRACKNRSRIDMKKRRG